MMEHDATFRAGQLIIITGGEYSDYSFTMICRVVKPFTASAVLSAYLEKFPEEKEDFYFSRTRFELYLLREGYVTELSAFEWHVEAYGVINEGDGVKDIKLYSLEIGKQE